MGKMTQITWPEEYSELQRIDELLLCGICYEYMDTSVMTPCSHNYCSLCIRKYLHYKTQCPACFEKTFEKDLHTNRILDDLVSYFGKIRVKLVDCIAGAKIERIQENEDVRESLNETPVRPARMNHIHKKTPPPKAAVPSPVAVDGAREYSNGVSASFGTVSTMTLMSPSTSGAPKVAKIFTPKSKGNVSAGISNIKTVQCPVCRVEISEVHVNKHLDDCLKRENAIPQSARVEPKRKPLPKLVFRLMKDTELRRKMKELGLPSQGDRKTLETRFQRYSILYNSECDKVEPRSIEELLKQCEEEENLEKKNILKTVYAANRLKVTRNSEQNVIEEAQKKYRETHKQSYENLIAAIKNRQTSKKLPVRRSLIGKDEKDVDGEDVPEKNLMQINGNDENDYRDPYSMIDYENVFQDSDSSSTCPLQHYASDDPTSFLSIQMMNPDGNSSTSSPTKSSPFRVGHSGDKSPNSPVPSATKAKLKGPPTALSANAANDIFNVTTDSESTDEDVVPPSPKAAKPHSTKRPKLSIQQKQTIDDAKPSFDENKSEGQKLALSIARDFTFDSSSNDSVETGAVRETAGTKTTDTLNGEARKAEHIATDILKRDKENLKSPTSSSNTVNRPVRKRNCVTRARKNNTVELTKLKETTISPPGRADYADVQVDEKVETAPRIDSPLKRRRGRKGLTSIETETKNPPRRPLRKRNSVVSDEAHKRS